MNDYVEQFETIIAGIGTGHVVPYLGPAALSGVTEESSGRPIPADSDSLILAINEGKPMAPKLMYEFPRAAMNLELKKGRSYVERALTNTYGGSQWTRSKIHDWLASLDAPYVIDINRDQQLQQAYGDRAHTLVLGVARIAGTNYRFRIFEFTGSSYVERSAQEVDAALPIVFKPLGTPNPEPTYIASDADFVDYITELMGGFAIPPFVKERRMGKKYVILGLRLTRDTERMILSEMMYGADPDAGWIFIEEPTDKEQRFCRKLGLTIVRRDAAALLG